MRLKKVSLRRRRENEMPGIRPRRWYLFRAHFGWMTGKFHRQWYGWEIDNPNDVVVCHELKDIQELYLMEP